MGYEVLADKISVKIRDMDLYISKGRHHLKWHIEDAAQAKHFDLLRLLLDTYPQAKLAMAEILARNIDPVCEDIYGLSRFDVINPAYKLSPERADFMIALLRARHRKATETVGR